MLALGRSFVVPGLSLLSEFNGRLAAVH